MKKKLDLSIIILSHNNYNILDICLKSIIKFTHGIEYEIIVVDNASKDETIQNLKKDYSSITLIKNSTNLGFAAANNIGIKKAKGEHCLLLNNDVVLLNNSLKSCFDILKQSKVDLLLGVQLLNNDGSFQESVVRFPTVWNTFTESFFLYKIFPNISMMNKYYDNLREKNQSYEVDVVKGAFIYSKLSTLIKLNGFDERFYFYSEETDLCYRFKNKGGRIVFDPRIKVVHLGGATTINNLKFMFKNQTISKMRFYKKHFSFIQYIAAVSIYKMGIIIRIPLYLIIGVIKMDRFTLLKSYYYLKQFFIWTT